MEWIGNKGEKQGKGRDKMNRGALVQERRRHLRCYLDLPLEYRMMDIPEAFGGVAVDGGEAGFLVHSLRDMSVGTKLNISLLFPNGFELGNLEAVVEIVRKVRAGKGQNGYRYGLKIVEMNKQDYVKLRYVLAGLHELGHGEPILQ